MFIFKPCPALLNEDVEEEEIGEGKEDEGEGEVGEGEE